MSTKKPAKEFLKMAKELRDYCRVNDCTNCIFLKNGVQECNIAASVAPCDWIFNGE